MTIAKPLAQSIVQSIVQPLTVVAGGSVLPTPLIHWRADSYTGTSGSYVLTDLSGNGRSATQAVGTATPGSDATSDYITMSGAQFNASGTIDCRPLTVVTVFTRSSGQATGFFGDSASTAYNSLWCGFESANRHTLYMGNGSTYTGPINTASAEHGSIRAYLALVSLGAGILGYDGTLQSGCTEARGLKTTMTPSLGGGYSSKMNGVWRETRVYSGVLTMTQQDALADELNGLYGISIAKWSSLTATPAVTINGQSNPAGRAPSASLPAEYQGDQTNVNIWTGGAFETLNIDTDNNNQLGESPNNEFGYEASLGKEYIDANGGEIYLVKWADGSTSLADRGTTECWAIDSTQISANEFKAASRETLQAIQAMQAAGKRPDWKAITWFQGEDDATTEAWANAYETNFAAFKPAFEAATLADPKWLLMRIADEGTETYKNTVRTAQANIAAAYSDVTMIDTDDYAMQDTVHLGPTGQIDLGTDLAALL